MDKMLSTIALRIWQSLNPWLEAKWELVEPKIEVWVKEKFEEWMPKIVRAVVVSISQSAGQLVVNTADKVTDIIPGPIDDMVVDTLVDRTRDTLAQFGIRF